MDALPGNEYSHRAPRLNYYVWWQHTDCYYYADVTLYGQSDYYFRVASLTVLIITNDIAMNKCNVSKYFKIITPRRNIIYSKTLITHIFQF